MYMYKWGFMEILLGFFQHMAVQVLLMIETEFN
jgi:hypothetical protein